MTDIAIIDWFGRWGTSVFSENTAIFLRWPPWFAQVLKRRVYENVTIWTDLINHKCQL